jgi:hypothetical protein
MTNVIGIVLTDSSMPLRLKRLRNCEEEMAISGDLTSEQ